jgi:hypothetical protein
MVARWFHVNQGSSDAITLEGKLSNESSKKKLLRAKVAKKMVTKQALIGRKNYFKLDAELGDANNAAMLRAMVDRAGAPVAMFARFMGVSRRGLYQYLARTRRTPNVAINAARFALGSMGVSMAISGDEIRRNLGFGHTAASPVCRKRRAPRAPTARRGQFDEPAPTTLFGDL